MAKFSLHFPLAARACTDHAVFAHPHSLPPFSFSSSPRAADRMRALERVVDETLARRTPAEVALGRKQWPSVRVALCGNGFDIMFAKALGLDVRFGAVSIVARFH
jgi:hypothetical protein